jgi:hypothetical protein
LDRLGLAPDNAIGHAIVAIVGAAALLAERLDG